MSKLTTVKVIDILLGEIAGRASQRVMISRGRHFGGGGLSLMLWWREMMEDGGWRMEVEVEVEVVLMCRPGSESWHERK